MAVRKKFIKKEVLENKNIEQFDEEEEKAYEPEEVEQ